MMLELLTTCDILPIGLIRYIHDCNRLGELSCNGFQAT